MCQWAQCAQRIFDDVKQSKQIEPTWHVRPNILCKQLKGFRHSNSRCTVEFSTAETNVCVFRPQHRSWNADFRCRSRTNDFHLILNYLLVFHHIPSAPFVTDDRWSVFALRYLFWLAFESFTFIFTNKINNFGLAGECCDWNSAKMCAILLQRRGFTRVRPVWEHIRCSVIYASAIDYKRLFV